MAKELLSEIPSDPETLNDWDDLRISFINFLHICACAISKNESLIDRDRRDYHKNLEHNFKKIQQEIIPMLRPHNTYI